MRNDVYNKVIHCSIIEIAKKKKEKEKEAT